MTAISHCVLASRFGACLNRSLLGMAGAFVGSEINIELPELQARASMTRDALGVPHIEAKNDHDLFLVQGYVQAMDRLFQMDVRRHLANGTLGELVGAGALPTDVELRTIGLHRAAARSLAALSPETQAALDAYAEGVNAFIAGNPLPIEYGALELSQIPPWTALDSVGVAKLLAFNLSFEIDVEPSIALLTYQLTGEFAGFDGLALYFEDVRRSAPFDAAATLPDSSGGPAPGSGSKSRRPHGPKIDASATAYLSLSLATRYRDRLSRVPLFEHLLPGRIGTGSNEWAIAGSLTTSGEPLIANDPHLTLDAPSVFHPLHLMNGSLNATGNSFAGVPFIILGHNDNIAWGATNNLVDVTDTYQEVVAVDPYSPSGLSTVYLGVLEPIIPIPEQFQQNLLGDGIFDNLEVVPPGGEIPEFTLIVPRRNEGPIVALDVGAGSALSIQYSGFSATRELDAFRIWNRAKGIKQFRQGLENFDFGSQNWAYSDREGNIAYFTSGELPIREDLAEFTVNGLPPYFIRDGTGGNEWVPDSDPGKNQALPYAVVPNDDLPRTVNPPAGWFVNANNDPVGFTLDNDPLNQGASFGIYYLNYTFDGAMRAGRITQMLQEKLALGPISRTDVEQMQADTVFLDAVVLVPYMQTAFARSQSPGVDPQLAALGADPGIQEAIGRLAAWDFSSPTGIDEGYDAADTDGVLSPPTSTEIAHSVAATLYSVWRGQFILHTIDATLAAYGLLLPDADYSLRGLRKLLDNFATQQGYGVSGLPFLVVPGVANPDDGRDILILSSLRAALDLLASSQFDAAFHQSSVQDDYRWGRLHRVVFGHPLGDVFNIPPAGGAFPPPFADLAGIPTDGGFATVDAAYHDARATSPDGFMFDSGPSRRFIGELATDRPHGQSSLPGGSSGNLLDPNYLALLPAWLTNEAYTLLLKKDEVIQNGVILYNFRPD